MAQEATASSWRSDVTPAAPLFRRFSDEATSQEWLEENRWHGEPWCRHCGSFNVRRNNHKSMPWRCAERERRKKLSVRVGTPLYRSPLGYQTWAIAIHLLATSDEKQSSMRLHRELGVTRRRYGFSRSASAGRWRQAATGVPRRAKHRRG